MKWLLAGALVFAIFLGAESRMVLADYQNLTILPKDIAPQDLEATMQRMADDLGVRCAHCHVGEDYAADTRAAKSTARTMITMTIALNRDYFPDADAPVLSCVTCHRGQLKPATLPRRGPRRLPPEVPLGPPDPRTLPEVAP